MNLKKGFTIVELMVGIAVGLLVLASAGAFIVTTLRDNLDNAKQQRFEQTIQILKYTIAAGIRRAGFSNSTTALADVSGWTAGTHYYTNGTCILYTYVDTELSPAKQQYFGYKLDTATGVLYSYQADNKVDCATNSTWQAITDSNQLTISEASAGTLFTTPTNPRVVQIHFLATGTGLATGGSPMTRDVLVKVFVRNG